MNETINLDKTGLERLLRAFKSMPRARVGILGAKNGRSAGTPSGETSNATLGAKHEFGDTDTEQRSFLRMPITDKLQEYLEKSGAFDEETLEKVVREGSIAAWIEKVGHVGERIVADAFATGGFGKWPKWKNPNYQNNTGQLLIDTQQLRNSITSEVKK